MKECFPSLHRVTAGRKQLPSRALALAAAILLAAGCGGPTVRGKVTLNGAPAKVVTVTFLGAANQQKTATTDNNGEFRLDKPPVGSVQVTVKSLATSLPMPAARPPVGKGADKLPPINAPETVEVPSKYSNPATSGLTTTLGKGRNTYDIKLE
jgi:hypothetical protein